MRSPKVLFYADDIVIIGSDYTLQEILVYLLVAHIVLASQV